MAMVDVAVLVSMLGVILSIKVWGWVGCKSELEAWVVEVKSGLCGFLSGFSDIFLPDMFETIWSILFFDTDKGRYCEWEEYGQGSFGSDTGNPWGSGGSDRVTECGGSFFVLIIPLIVMFWFFADVHEAVVRGRKVGGFAVRPGGLADDVLGRLFSEICRVLQDEEGLHFSM